MEHKQKPSPSQPGAGFPRKDPLADCGSQKRAEIMGKLLGYTFDDIRWLKADPKNIDEVAEILADAPSKASDCAAKLLSIAVLQGVQIPPGAEKKMREVLQIAKDAGDHATESYLNAALLGIEAARGAQP